MSNELARVVYQPKGKNPRIRKVVCGKYMNIGEERFVPVRVAETLKADKDLTITFPKKAAEKKAAEKQGPDDAGEESGK